LAWKKSGVVLLLLSCLHAPSPGSAASATGATGAVKGRFVGEEIIIEGLALSYRLQLRDALTVFSRLETEHPGSPASAFYPAAITWGYVESDLRWRRVAELHAKTKVTKKFSTGSAKKLLEDMEKTIGICNEILETDEDDFEALFYLAGAHGFASRMEFYNGNYLSAMVHGRYSADRFELLLVKHPDKGDALLGPGVYKYFVGSLPPAFRFIASMLGLSGSKEEGLELIEAAYRDSTISRTESADFLALIQGRFENDFPVGLFWADKIEKENRASPLADYHRLLISHHSGDRAGEERAAVALKERMKPVAKGLKNDWDTLLDYTIGAIRQENGETQSARRYFKKAYKAPKLDTWLRNELKTRLDIN
jgi:tetratricopeptide (TPR) repeat protein